MPIKQYLGEIGYTKKEEFKHIDKKENIEIVLSEAYEKSGVLVVVDAGGICGAPFSYKRYCQKQNEWVKKYKRVYRILDSDDEKQQLKEIETLKTFLNGGDVDYDTGKTMDREKHSIDPSPLEYLFEECFERAYGASGYKYLQREYSIVLKNGKTAYIDYALFNKDGTWIAIEENGVSYHHPSIIGEKRYRKMLFKQNSIVEQDGIIYRWDTESMQHKDRIVDEILEFVGDISKYHRQDYVKEQRGFKLYDHQEEYLYQLKNDREAGIESALVVLPTGTGKTTVAIEDLREFYVKHSDFRALVLVPSLALVNQWEAVLSQNAALDTFTVVKTYAKASREYYNHEKDFYDYIVIDEAHHGAAPVIRKILHHYKPKFLLGLTATDERLDEKKLEEVFGAYNTKLSLKEAIEKGILAPIRAYRLETNIDLSSVKFNGKDYIFSQLEKSIKIPSRNELIADVVKTYFCDRLKGKSGLVFCVSVAHAKEMAKIMRARGINAESIDGKDKKRVEKIDKYMNKDIQFLCTCSLLTEGWDAPHTAVIIMARPTLSKVLYTQQLGRGTRKCEGKEALYVVDIVDNYGSYGSVSNRPWSVHSLLGIDTYKMFGDLINTGGSTDELVVLDTIHESLVKLAPFDVFTMQQYYEDYLSTEELARALFVSTGTVNNWIRKNQIEPSVTIPMGRGKLSLFHPDQVSKIREEKNLKEHTEETIVDDFWEFIEKGDYTFSYKMYFKLAFLDKVNETGDVDVKELLERYIEYYEQRHLQGLQVDRENSPYNDIDYVRDRKKMKTSMLSNPFEKFERKRFLYHDKDLAKIAIHHRIWDDLVENGGMERLRRKMEEDLVGYYGDAE